MRVKLTGKHGFMGRHLSPMLTLDDTNFDVIVHAGANTSVNDSIVSPKDFAQENITSTLRELENARAKGVPFWYISSAEVYGPSSEPLPKGTPFNPSNPYAGSKAACEMLAISYANTYKFPLHVVNTMHLFGEDAAARTFVPATVAKLLAGEPAVIYGYSTRHWLYIDDFCERLVTEMRVAANSPGVHRHHLIGKQMSCAELGHRIAQILDKPFASVNSDFHLNPGHTAHYSAVSDIPYSDKDLMRGLTKTVEALAATPVGRQK